MLESRLEEGEEEQGREQEQQEEQEEQEEQELLSQFDGDEKIEAFSARTAKRDPETLEAQRVLQTGVDALEFGDVGFVDACARSTIDGVKSCAGCTAEP